MFFSYEPISDDGLIDYSDGTKLSLKGVCKEAIYVSDKDDFAIIRFEDSDDNCFKIKGNIKEMKSGCSYNIEGTVKTYNNEKQLSIYSFLECQPFTRRGVIAYLQTLPGLYSKAELIYDTFGKDTLDILENDPMQLTSIKGIGEKSVEKWVEEIQKNVSKKHLILELLGYGLTQKQCMKLIQEYDSSIIKKIRTNPYFLITEVKGFGFVTCDKIAMNMGFQFNDVIRVLHIAEYVLEKESMIGHTFCYVDDMLPKMKELIDISLTKDELNSIIDEKRDSIYKFNKNYDLDINYVKHCYYNNDIYYLDTIELQEIKDIIISHSLSTLILEENRLYLKRLYKAEVNFSERIVEICRNKIEVFTREEVEMVLDIICKKDNIQLEEMQREAIITFNMYDTGVFILNGSAGTGKTFVAKLILKVGSALNYAYKRNVKITFLPLAPTGKATKVMQKSLNTPCQTIHRGLQYTEEGFMKNKRNPFPENSILVDETSMLDIELASHFIDAVHNDTKVILIGDTKQLPSVGPGKVLKDLIESEIPIIVTLNVVKRQGEFSGIIRNANRIIFGEMIISEPESDDFYIHDIPNIMEIQKQLSNTFYQYCKKYEISDVQVLSPQKPGILGVNMLNFLMQRMVNPLYEGEPFVKKGSFDVNGKVYDINIHARDKVINIKNDYSLQWHELKYGQYVPMKGMGITNGECGIVETIRKNENGKLEVVVKYEDFYILYEDVSNLDLAYALTIHKSQGSQWPIVLMPIVSQHNYILSNNLLYTAITRTTEKCEIFGQSSAIYNAINNYKEDIRNTTLKERLIKENNAYE